MRFNIRHLLLLTFIVAVLIATEMYLALWWAAQESLKLAILGAILVPIVLTYHYLIWQLVPIFLRRKCPGTLRWLVGRKQAAKWLNEYGNILYKQDEFPTAADAYSAAIDVDPAVAVYWENRGMARMNLDDISGCESDINEAIELDSTQERVYFVRAQLRFARHDFRGCLDDFPADLPRSRNYSQLFLMRGAAHERLRNWADAIEDYATALELNAEMQDAGIALSRLQSGCPDDACRNGANAVEHATRSCVASNWKFWIPVSILASAYAEMGDFQRAIEFAELASSLAPADEKPERLRRIEQYRAGIPFRIQPTDTTS